MTRRNHIEVKDKNDREWTRMDAKTEKTKANRR